MASSLSLASSSKVSLGFLSASSSTTPKEGLHLSSKQWEKRRKVKESLIPYGSLLSDDKIVLDDTPVLFSDCFQFDISSDRLKQQESGRSLKEEQIQKQEFCSPSATPLPFFSPRLLLSFIPFFFLLGNPNMPFIKNSNANAAVTAKAIQTDFTIPVDVTVFNRFLQNVDSIKKDLGITRVRTTDLKKSIRTLDLISLRTAIDETLNQGRGGSASDWIERRKVVDKVFRTVTADVINLEEITNKISKKELEVDFPASKRVKVMEPMMKKLETDVQRLVASLAEEDANVALGSARARFSLCSNGYLICDNYK